jgi:hypothetical protein
MVEDEQAYRGRQTTVLAVVVDLADRPALSQPVA